MQSGLKSNYRLISCVLPVTHHFMAFDLLFCLLFLYKIKLSWLLFDYYDNVAQKLVWMMFIYDFVLLICAIWFEIELSFLGLFLMFFVFFITF
jgi:hypothetical protein